MASVVFFRAVNVGGHQRFQTSVLAKQLADFGVVNIGAAGTFVVRKNVSQATLRAEILRRLAFKPELMICPARDVIALKRDDPFQDAPDETKDLRHYVTIMTKHPERSLPCPSKNPPATSGRSNSSPSPAASPSASGAAKPSASSTPTPSS